MTPLSTPRFVNRDNAIKCGIVVVYSRDFSAESHRGEEKMRNARTISQFLLTQCNRKSRPTLCG